MYAPPLRYLVSVSLRGLYAGVLGDGAAPQDMHAPKRHRGGYGDSRANSYNETLETTMTYSTPYGWNGPGYTAQEAHNFPSGSHTALEGQVTAMSSFYVPSES
jgi:hypothetical protein